MTFENIITSAQNQRIKRLVALQQKSVERKKSGLFVVEGVRELLHCIRAGYKVECLFRCQDILGSNPDAQEIKTLAPDAPIYDVSKKVYEKMAYRGTTEGLMAEMRAKNKSLNDIKLPENPFLVVLESVEKPGNLGAVLRSADASGVDAVIVCDPLTDLFNPNLIRSSIGAVFTVPTLACSTEECIAFLNSHGIQILTAQLQDSTLYYNTDMRQPTAIVMGTEATGLTNAWRQAANAHIRIPMLGHLDSLNVSVSAAILMYEVVRQRNHGIEL